MPLTTSAYRTHAPFHPEIREAIRQRRYSLTVTFPDGHKKDYTCLSHFAHTRGKRLEHIRARTIYAEMDIGDSADAKWLDPDAQTFVFTFTRVR